MQDLKSSNPYLIVPEYLGGQPSTVAQAAIARGCIFLHISGKNYPLASNCVFFPPESVKCCSISSLSPNRSSNSRTRTRPPSEVTRDPWKSTFKVALKES